MSYSQKASRFSHLLIWRCTVYQELRVVQTPVSVSSSLVSCVFGVHSRVGRLWGRTKMHAGVGIQTLVIPASIELHIPAKRAEAPDSGFQQLQLTAGLVKHNLGVSRSEARSPRVCISNKLSGDAAAAHYLAPHFENDWPWQRRGHQVSALWVNAHLIFWEF